MWRVRTVLDPARDPDPGGPGVTFGDDVATVRIGRRRDLELTLPFRALSAVHARIRREPDGSWTLEDLGSLNGTDLDGERLVPGRRHPLPIGSRIGLGVVAIVFEGPVTDEGHGTDAGAKAGSAPEGTVTIARRLVNDLLAGDPGAGVPTLTVLRGALPATLRLDILDRRYVVGRGERAALHLAAEEISRAHATFTRDWEGVTVDDLGSTNGVYVNGSRVVTQPLQDGDVVELGPIALRFKDPAERYQRELAALANDDGAAPAAPGPAAPEAPPVAAPEPPAAPPPPRPLAPGARSARLAAAVLAAVAAIVLAIAVG